jgi:hypothetical protein
MANIFQAAGRAIWASTDSLTKWIQVIALCIAAWWTFTNYSVADKPSLEPNMSVDSSLQTYSKGSEPNTCLKYYSIKVKNDGKVSFDVNGLHFLAWHVESLKAGPQEATFINEQNLSRGEKIIDLSIPSKDPPITSSSLIRHYPPGQGFQQDFTWILRQQKPGITYFTVEVSAKSGKKSVLGYDSTKSVVGYGSTWSNDVCGDAVPPGQPLAEMHQQREPERDPAIAN